MPHYPVRQPDGMLAVWSTIVDHFTSFDNLVTEAAEEINRWHTGDSLPFCQQVADGQKPFDHWHDWETCVSTAISRHGEDDETTQMALELTTDRRLIDALVALSRAEIRADECAYELENLRQSKDNSLKFFALTASAHGEPLALTMHTDDFGNLYGYAMLLEADWHEYLFDPDTGTWEPRGEHEPPEGSIVTLTNPGRRWLERWNNL